MVISGEHHDTAPRGCAGEITVLYGIHGTVDTRAFAIPERRNPLVSCFGQQGCLLRTPAGGGRYILIEPRMKNNAMFFEHLL